MEHATFSMSESQLGAWVVVKRNVTKIKYGIDGKTPLKPVMVAGRTR